MNRFRKKFLENGFYIEKNLIKEIDLKNIKNLFEYLIQSLTNEKFKFKDFESENFHDNLRKLRSLHPKKFSSLYEIIKNSASIKKLFLSNKVQNIASKILSIPSERLSTSGSTCGMYSNIDMKNTFNWHQDCRYYEQNLKMNSGCVAIIPLLNSGAFNGNIQYVSNSHKISVINHKKKNKKFSLMKKDFNLGNIKTFEINFGDILFFDLNIIHKSGINNSDKFRLNCETRFHSIVKGNYYLL